MQRIKKALVGAGAAALMFGTTIAPSVAAAATTANLTVTPSSVGIFDSNNVAGVAGDSAPGFASGSVASDGSGKTDMYFTPTMLFSREVTLGEVSSMSYWTKKAGNHTDAPADWSLTIYTKPYVGDASSPAWYGDRIGTEPYYAINLADPAGQWNNWTTGGSSNQMRFYESTAGATGANFGTYADPAWTGFLAAPALSGANRASENVLFFSLQTGSATADGFTGQVDGMTITLADGSIANVNLEPVSVVPATKEQCMDNGWKTLSDAQAGGNSFKNQGDCVSFVATKGENKGAGS